MKRRRRNIEKRRTRKKISPERLGKEALAATSEKFHRLGFRETLGARKKY